MKLRFYQDPQTGEAHILNHAVSEDEVAQVLERPRVRYRGTGDSRIAIGQTESGRWLQVVMVEDLEPTSYFVITAYPPRPNLVRAIRRRRGN